MTSQRKQRIARNVQRGVMAVLIAQNLYYAFTEDAWGRWVFLGFAVLLGYFQGLVERSYRDTDAAVDYLDALAEQLKQAEDHHGKQD